MISAIKDAFPIFRAHPKLVYLDTAATAQKPQVVIDRMRDFYERQYATIHRGMYDLSQNATDLVDEARSHVAALIAAHRPDEVIFVRNATEGINLLAATLKSRLEEGSEIVLSEMEHHSNMVPWQEIARETGAVLRWIPITKQFKLDISEAQKLISKKTRIVSVTHASNVLGAINPIARLSELAHAVGALMIVDAAHSVPHCELNVKQLGCDALVFSGHKLYGPTGVGVVWVRDSVLSTLPPFLTGGDMVSDVTKERAQFQDPPRKWEAGTPDIAGIVGLGAAIQWIREIGFSDIQAHEKELGSFTLEKLLSIPNFTLHGPSTVDHRVPTFSFTLSGIHPHDLASLLSNDHIAIRAGHHCAQPLHTALGIPATARISLGIYSTREDIDAFVNSILSIQKLYGSAMVS